MGACRRRGLEHALGIRRNCLFSRCGGCNRSLLDVKTACRPWQTRNSQPWANAGERVGEPPNI
jgi:hypothetical protein